MAQFLVYLDEFQHINYVALDDISGVVSPEKVNELYKSVIYLKSDPDIELNAALTTSEVMRGTVINIGKLL